MAPGSRAAWQRMKTSIAAETTASVGPVVAEEVGELSVRLEARLEQLSLRLDAIERELTVVGGHLRELREIAEAQADVENQATELLGRLLRSATDRLDELEARMAKEG